jgi:hypothetical protein
VPIPPQSVVYHLNAVLIEVYLGSKFRPSLSEIVFELLLSISENFLSAMSTLLAKTVPLLDALQLLMLFVQTLTYLVPNLFLLIIFYNLYSLIIKTLTVIKINVCVCVCVFLLIAS